MGELSQDQAILIFKELEALKKGMKQVVALLGVVVKHIEGQAKPAEAPIATRALLYPHLSTASTPALAEEAAVVEEPPCAPPHAFVLAGAFPGEGTRMMPPNAPPLWQYASQFQQWFQAHQVEAFAGLGVFCLGAAALKQVLRRRKRQDLTSHGSARWPTPKEVRAYGLSQAHGVVLGDYGGVTLLDDSERHVLLLAPSGSGKDVMHINPTLAWGWTESALVLDPKDGETYERTAEARTQYGRVEAFAPYRRGPLACFNLLDTVRMGEPEEFGDALAIGQSLTASQKREERTTGGGVHFRELAALTIAATVLHCRYASPHAAMSTVWEFLTQQGSFLKALQVMQQTPHTRHGVHYAVAELSRMVSNIGDGEELSSAWSTTLRPLFLYLDPYVAASTDRSTFTIDDLQYGAQPLSLYMLAPSPRALLQLYPVFRAVFDVVLRRLMEHTPGSFRHRLLISANEFPSYGFMPELNKGAADIRGYGMKLFAIAQDLTQFEDVYGRNSDIWTNTACKLFHSPANDEAAKRISENFLGMQTVEYMVESRNGRGRPTRTPHRTGRRLLTTDEVGRLGKDTVLVWLKDERPFLATKCGYDRRLAA
jgi:type IV secretion system protein VirD4